MERSSTNTNICFDCKNSVCGCSWSRDFTPVPGWTAKETTTQYVGNDHELRVINGYHITACPEFCPDGDRKAMISTGLAQPVVCLTTGQLYPSISAAAREYGFGTRTVHTCIRLGKSYKGFRWAFIGGDA